MRVESTDEMKELEKMIEPYLNWDDIFNKRFKDGTPDEIIEAQKKLTELSIEQTLELTM